MYASMEKKKSKMGYSRKLPFLHYSINLSMNNGINKHTCLFILLHTITHIIELCKRCGQLIEVLA